jgi:hypothetical protein
MLERVGRAKKNKRMFKLDKNKIYMIKELS